MGKELNLIFTFRKNDLSSTTQIHLSLNRRSKRKKEKEKGESLLQESKLKEQAQN